MAENMQEYLREGVQSVVSTFQAQLREAAKDLHNAIVPAFPDSQRGVDEPGTPLTPTSREVYEQKNAPQMDAGYAKQLAEFQQQMGGERQQEQQAEMER